MSQETNNVAVDPRQLSIWNQARKWLMPNDRGEAKTAYVLSDTDTPQKILEKLHEYSIDFFRPKGDEAAIAAADVDDDSVYIIEPRYNEQQLTILEDCYISDVVVHKLVDKLNFTVFGKHGRTVLDTKIEFPNEKERMVEISRISKNEKYRQIKAQIDDLFTVDNLDLHSNLFDLGSNFSVFGRACFFIVKDEKGNWTQLILLDSKRLGRVKVDKITRKVVAVEYQDVEVNGETGKMTPAIQVSTTAQNPDTQTSAEFLPAEDLIYIPNKAGGIGKNTRYVGYSLLEPIVHLSQVKRIVLNKNLKEAAETHYMGFGRYQFDPNTPDALITNFINSVKGATGKFFGHKIPVQSFIEKIPVDLEKYNDVVDILNREMIRASGLASFLFGYEQIANYANSEQVNLASREIDIAFLKTMFKDIIAQKIINPLVELLSKSSDISADTQIDEPDTEPLTEEKTQEEPAATAAVPPFKVEGEEDSDEGKPDLEEDDDEEDPEIDPEQAKLNDQYIKLTYEFQDLNFNTKKEAAEMLAIVNGMVALPKEAILRTVGLDDWVEETLAEDEKKQKEKAEKAKEMFEQFKQGGNNNPNPNDPNAQGPQQGQPPNNNFGRPYNQNPAAVALAEDPDYKDAMLDLIKTQKAMYEEIRADVRKSKATV